MSTTGSTDELNAMSDRIETATERLQTIVAARSAARSSGNTCTALDEPGASWAELGARIARIDRNRIELDRLLGNRHLHVVPDIDD